MRHFIAIKILGLICFSYGYLGRAVLIDIQVWSNSGTARPLGCGAWLKQERPSPEYLHIVWRLLLATIHLDSLVFKEVSLTWSTLVVPILVNRLVLRQYLKYLH